MIVWNIEVLLYQLALGSLDLTGRVGLKVMAAFGGRSTLLCTQTDTDISGSITTGSRVTAHKVGWRGYCRKSGFLSRLVLLSEALYHACFMSGQRCNWWSRRPKLTSLVISDVKRIIYIFQMKNQMNSSIRNIWAQIFLGIQLVSEKRRTEFQESWSRN